MVATRTSPSVVWFRRDLRLSDHPALLAAAAHGPVVPVFVIDPAFGAAGPVRHAVLAEAVTGLAASIRELGGELIIRRGDPTHEVPTLAAEVGAERVFVTGDASPYGLRRDRQVAERLSSAGRALVAVGSNHVVAPGRIRKSDGTPYAVFTPFYRRWLEAVATDTDADADNDADADVDADVDIDAANRRDTALPAAIVWGSAPSADLPTRLSDVVERTGLVVTEGGAWERWDEFIGDASGSNAGCGLANYDEARDVPAVDGTSRLSAHLKFGVVHPRQLMAEVDESLVGHAAFVRELAFRDFYADVVYHHPTSVWRNLNPKFDRIRVDTDEEAQARFDRWCAGTTGFPIVDAGMRQLNHIGWMHNRVRMIVASFLVKDLHLPWQWGASYFMHHLADGDIASNSQGWQWAAGSGTDAAPYFRVFNPTTQMERWDPTGDYVARWIPELDTGDYPAPMVDHGAERDEALARYAETRQS